MEEGQRRMASQRVAIRVPVGRPLPEVASFAARCEDAGFDGVGIHDHPSSGRDAYLALALAAGATQRLRLFPATSSPIVRHPLVLASLAHSMDEIAPGRTVLTVAPGFISTRSIGQPRAGLGVMRDSIRDLRRLLAGDEVGFGPSATRLRNRSATPTPVYLLAAGPRMIELAGEVADGALLFVGLHPAAIRAARSHLEAGAKRAGRSLSGFPVVFVVTLGLGADADVGARWVRSWFAPGQPFLAYPSSANLHWLAQAGFDRREKRVANGDLVGGRGRCNRDQCGFGEIGRHDNTMVSHGVASDCGSSIKRWNGLVFWLSEAELLA